MAARMRSIALCVYSRVVGKPKCCRRAIIIDKVAGKTDKGMYRVYIDMCAIQYIYI